MGGETGGFLHVSGPGGMGGSVLEHSPLVPPGTPFGADGVKQLLVAKAAELGTLTGSSLWVVLGKASNLSGEDKSNTRSRGSRTFVFCAACPRLGSIRAQSCVSAHVAVLALGGCSV